MKSFALVSDRLRLAAFQGMFLTDEERSSLGEEIDRIIESIAQKSSFDEANSRLLELGTMQEVLATLCFKNNITLTEKQRRLVRDYDRWHVTAVKASAYNAIKNAEFIRVTPAAQEE